MAKAPEDRQHDVRMAFLGFILTTVLGGAITFFWHVAQVSKQAREHTAEAERTLVEKRRDAAGTLFDDLMVSIDTRFYRTRQVVWAFDDPAKLQATREKYHDELEAWNFRLNHDRALVCRYFGPKVGERYETLIMPSFRHINALLNEAIKSKTYSQPAVRDRLNGQLDNLNAEIYQFSNELAEELRVGDVGSKDTDKACYFNPAPYRPED